MIEFRGVTKTYPNGTTALKDVNLTIEDGEFVFIVGSSGAGKSTFLKLIIREEVANAGKIRVNGFDFSTMKKRDVPYMRRTMGIVFQDFRLIPKMTVFDNVAFAMRVTGAPPRQIRKRVSKVLALVGLSHKARCMRGALRRRTAESGPGESHGQQPEDDRGGRAHRKHRPGTVF